MIGTSDEQLMERVGKGEIDMLEHLVRRYEKPIYSFIVKMVGNNAEADDIFQETFLRVYQKRKLYRNGAAVSPWLYKICLNLCRDALRRRSRQKDLPLDDLPLPDPDPGPEQSSLDNFTIRKVIEAISGLPEKQKEVFLLHHYQGLKYHEIADILSTSVGTVKSRMHYAVTRLSELLCDLEVETA